MMRIFLCLIFLIGQYALANEHVGEKKNEEVALPGAEATSIVDFNAIKDLIKKDGLDEELKKKEASAKKIKEEKKLIELRRYNVPGGDVFWSFFSELWLVKNAPKLKWDFQKPDFELDSSFASFLQSMGFYEKKFKILLLDTPEIIHAGLPANENECLLLLSYPFLKTLDLSKVEINLILFEDFIRLQKGYFKNFVNTKELETYLGSNFNGKAFNKKLIDDHLKKYNQLIYEKGFTFQEQFEVTKEMDSLLKNDSKMWTTYFSLIEKIDQLFKTNPSYKSIGSIYPSPELQMGWLKSKKSE